VLGVVVDTVEVGESGQVAGAGSCRITQLVIEVV